MVKNIGRDFFRRGNRLFDAGNDMDFQLRHLREALQQGFRCGAKIRLAFGVSPIIFAVVGGEQGNFQAWIC